MRIPLSTTPGKLTPILWIPLLLMALAVSLERSGSA